MNTPRRDYYAEDARAALDEEADLPGVEPTAIALRQRAQTLATLEVAAAIDRLADLHASRT